MFRAVELYTFLEYCNDSPLEKEVLECGAGTSLSLEPLLMRFYEHGYVTHGIAISNERLRAAQEFCERRQMDLDLRQGDMRQIPFEDESLSFVFSYNTIFHMTKQDITAAMREIERVLKPGGRVIVLELDVPPSFWTRLFVGFWFFYWLPFNFETPTRRDLMRRGLDNEVREAGFREVRKTSVFRGVFQVVRGVHPPADETL